MSTSRADNTMSITFTDRGEAAIEDLAAAVAAQCDGSPEGVEETLRTVMHDDLDQLALALSEAAPTGPAAVYDNRGLGEDTWQMGPGPDDVPLFEIPDDAAARRLNGRERDVPQAGPMPSRAFER